MSDVYGAEMNLVRVNEEPYTGRAKYGAKSNRVRMTGLSFASFKENIRQKKIEKKVAKYNEEYKALFDLAIGVDEARQEYTEGKSDYSVVKENIELYNSQARRLAEIGVQVLMLNSDIQKISFDKESSAKALKVPGFLIGPLKMLSKAGREKARAENEARLEKERAIAEAIVATAEEAVGQLKNDEVNEEKLVSLDFANVGEMVADKLVEPTVDEEALRKAAEEEARRREEEAAKAEKEKAAAKAKEEAEAKERIAKLKASGDEALKKNYGKGKKSGHDGATKAVAAVEKEDAFDILRSIDDVYCVALAKKDERLYEVLGVKIDGKAEMILPTEYGEKLKAVTGQDIPQEVVVDLYKRTLDMARLANAWKQVATREVAMEDGVKTIGAFDEENRNVFNFVYDGATNGLTFDELKAKATAELTEDEIKVVEEVDSRYELIAKGMGILKEHLAEEKVGAKETTEETPVVSDDKTEMYKVGNAKLAELALAIYGKKEPIVDEEVEEEEITPAEVVEEVPEEKGAVVTKDAEDKEKVKEQQKANLGFVDQIEALVAEIEALTASRDKLRGLVGDDKALESLNNSINERLAMINALASGGIVTLGKEGDKKEAVAEEVTDEVEEEITPAEAVEVGEKPAVLTSNEEMKVEEKAEIDARVVTGAHVHVDAKPENFSQDNRYAVAKKDPYIEFMSGALNQEEAEAFANRGILTDAEREDAIEWWSRMGALLDNPDAIKLSEMRVAEKKAEEERRALEDKVARDEFEINRQRRIAEEHERMAEQTARLQLRHCKPLEEYDIDEFIAANGQNVKEEDRFTTPSGLVRYMQKNAPNMYKEMMDGYNESMADKQAFMIENGHSFSEESVGKFARK